MAEIVGVVASGAGLASLAIQLSSSALKLKRFRNNVRNAPKALHDIIHEIETHSLLFKMIERDPPHTKSNLDPAIMSRCLEMCQEATSRIEETASTLERRLESGSISASIKTALKERELQDMFGRLERAKTTLQLAWQIYAQERHSAAQEQHTHLVEHQLASILNQLASLRTNTDEDWLAFGDHPFTLSHTARSTRVRRRMRNITRRHAYLFKLPFVSLVWQFSVSEAPFGWDMHLTCFATISKSSPIFQLCAAGDLVGVQDLLRSGQASVHDKDPRGLTPLHYAVPSQSLDVCEYLLANGADPNGSQLIPHPLTMVYILLRGERQCHPEMVRLFTGCSSLDVDAIFDDDVAIDVPSNHRLPMWYACESEEIITSIHRRLCVPYAQHDIHDRFQRAMELPSSWTDVDKFCTVVGTCNIEEVVAFKHEYNGTIVHFAAAAMGEMFSWLYKLKPKAKAKAINKDEIIKRGLDWMYFIMRAIRAGADIHAVRKAFDNDGQPAQLTPMLVYLQALQDVVDDVPTLFQVFGLWVKMVPSASVDGALAYGRKEGALWAQLPSNALLWTTPRSPWWTYTTKLEVEAAPDGSGKSTWILRFHPRIAVWKYVTSEIPGAFNVKDAMPKYWFGPHARLPPQWASGKWELDRLVELEDEGSLMCSERKSDICRDLKRRPWEECDGSALSDIAKRKMHRKLRRSYSVGTSVPDSERETPDAFALPPYGRQWIKNGTILCWVSAAGQPM